MDALTFLVLSCLVLCAGDCSVACDCEFVMGTVTRLNMLVDGRKMTTAFLPRKQNTLQFLYSAPDDEVGDVFLSHVYRSTLIVRVRPFFFSQGSSPARAWSLDDVRMSQARDGSTSRSDMFCSLPPIAGSIPAVHPRACESWIHPLSFAEKHKLHHHLRLRLPSNPSSVRQAEGFHGEAKQHHFSSFRGALAVDAECNRLHSPGVLRWSLVRMEKSCSTWSGCIGRRRFFYV